MCILTRWQWQWFELMSFFSRCGLSPHLWLPSVVLIAIYVVFEGSLNSSGSWHSRVVQWGEPRTGTSYLSSLPSVFLSVKTLYCPCVEYMLQSTSTCVCEDIPLSYSFPEGCCVLLYASLPTALPWLTSLLLNACLRIGTYQVNYHWHHIVITVVNAVLMMW